MRVPFCHWFKEPSRWGQTDPTMSFTETDRNGQTEPAPLQVGDRIAAGVHAREDLRGVEEGSMVGSKHCLELGGYKSLG